MTFIKKRPGPARYFYGISFYRLLMSLPLATLLALVICLTNDLLDKQNAPTGIVLTPVVLVLTTVLLNHRRQGHQVLSAALLTALLICLHDAGIKLYGGGAHDLEGQGVMTAFLFIGLLPAYLLQLFFLARAVQASVPQQLGAALAIPLLVGSYLFFFSSYLYFATSGG